MVEPYDYTQLNEIVLFKGKKEPIELSRDGRYINLIKKSEIKKRYYRYDLKEEKFQRINFYKTKDDKITDVNVSNITTWFYEHKIITKDIHFGRLILFAKFNLKFKLYKSPVRFIQFLGDDSIKAVEQWEAIGIKIKEVEDFFGKMCFSPTKKDYRKSVYEGEIPTDRWGRPQKFYFSMTTKPGDCSKDLLDYIKKEYTEISSGEIRRLYNQYNNGEFFIEKRLKEIGKDPEFVGIFHYTSQFRSSANKERWIFGTSSESNRARNHLIHAIRTYNLDLISLCKWIKKQINVDKNDVGYLFGDGNHYNDYLLCEMELNDGKMTKMDKYPDNFRSQFHRVQEEYAAKKGDIDKAKFKLQKNKHIDLEHTGRKFCVKIPDDPSEINYEAQQLHHCVRTYIPRVVAGKTLIAFLRDKKDPDEPLITLEVKKGALTQAYGKNDSKPKKEHLEFLKMWCNMKNINPGCWSADLKG